MSFRRVPALEVKPAYNGAEALGQLVSLNVFPRHRSFGEETSFVPFRNFQTEFVAMRILARTGIISPARNSATAHRARQRRAPFRCISAIMGFVARPPRHKRSKTGLAATKKAPSTV